MENVTIPNKVFIDEYVSVEDLINILQQFDKKSLVFFELTSFGKIFHDVSIFSIDSTQSFSLDATRKNDGNADSFHKITIQLYADSDELLTFAKDELPQ